MAPNLKNKMLHRSFNPAKCKMALKLAVSRIKLMKNKKEALFKQQKREVAQLLESGQEQTARIRVEHVVREEKTMAAFELIEIYCELIVARLPIIESQKNCPIDLKEAITSVIFASPRCADIPELSDIQKHLTAKYGKEFTTAAIELRPDCGVSRMLVEKLSAKAPDGITKMKILSAIAEEHNIKWDAKSFGEDRKPSEDLLNGPNTFENTSKIHVELPNVQTPPRHDQRNDAPVNLHEHNRNSSLNSQTYAQTDTPESRPSRSEGMIFRHSSSGDGNDFHVGRQNWNMEFKDATSAAQAAAESAERASMAARAAAELSSQGKITRQYSNESQKSYVSGLREEGREYYTGSKVHGGHFAKNSVDNSFHDTKTRINNVGTGIEENARAGAAETSRSHSRKSSQSASPKSSTSFSDDDTLINDVQLDGYSKQSPSEVAGLKTSSGDRVMKQQSSRSKLELPNEGRVGVKTGNIDSYGEERYRKQSSSASSISHLSSGGGHDFVSNSSHQKIADDADKNPFAFMDQDRIQTDTKLTHSSDNAAVVFDDSGSEDDHSKFTFGGDYDRYESAFFTSPDRKSPTPSYFSADTITSVTGKNMSKAPGMSVSQSHLFTETPEFSEGLTRSEVPSQLDDSVPVTFDHSAGPSSESEEELDKFKLSGTTKQNIYSGNPEPDQSESPWLAQSSFAEKVNSGSNRKQRLKAYSDDLGSVETNHHQNQETEYNVEGQKRSNFGVSPTQKMSLRLTESQMDSSDIDHKSPYSASDKEKPQQYSEFSSNKNDYPAETPTAVKDDNQSSLDVEKELKFGMLTGGIRNKRNQRPPYIRKPSIDASSKHSGEKTFTSESSMTSGAYNQKVSTKGDKKSSSKTQVTYDSDSDDSDEEHVSSKHSGKKTSTSESSMPSGAYYQKVSTKEDKKSSSKTQVTSDSDSDDSDEELTQQTFRREPSSQRSGAKVGDKTGSRMHHTYFDFDDGDSEENSSRQNITSKGHLGSSALSRRTKASPSQSGKTSYSKPKLTPEVSVTSDHGAERSSSRSSYAIETRTTESQTVSSSDYGSSEQASSNKQATPKTRPEYKNSQREESLKASAVEQPSSLHSKIAASGSTESLKPSSSSGNAPSRENSLKKASHVHPKLPDYDDFAAHFQSLRSNRK